MSTPAGAQSILSNGVSNPAGAQSILSNAVSTTCRCPLPSPYLLLSNGVSILVGAQSILSNGVSTTSLPGVLVNYVDSLQPSLWTVLHHAAASSFANSRALQRILQAGAFRSLKTRRGETACDIAVKRGRGEEIINILTVPDAVTENREAIDRMETALHEVIRERVQSLIDKHGLQLPQISIMWETELGEKKF